VCLSVEIYVVNLSSLRLRIAFLNLLLAMLYSRRLFGACVLCQFARALRFRVMRRLISDGSIWEVQRRFQLGLATCAACWRIVVNVVTAASISSLVLRVSLLINVSLIVVL
jgi:hypothetical protein